MYCVDDVIKGVLTFGPGAGPSQCGPAAQLVVRVPRGRSSEWKYEVLASTVPIEKGGGVCTFELQVPHCNELAELLLPDTAAEIDYSVCVVDSDDGCLFEKSSILLFRRIQVLPKYSEDEIREMLDLDYKVNCVTTIQLRKLFKSCGSLQVQSTECVALQPLETAYISLLLTYSSGKRVPPKITKVSYNTQLQYTSPAQGRTSRDISKDCLSDYNIEWISKTHAYCALLQLPITVPQLSVPSFAYRSTSYHYVVRITLETTHGAIGHNVPVLVLM